MTNFATVAPPSKAVFLCYARAFLWVSLAFTILAATFLYTDLIIVDFVRGNPNRTKANVLLMMIVFPPIIGIFSLIGSVLVLAVPQGFQAALSYLLSTRFSAKADIGILLALPLTSLLTWFCYDYLTPSDLVLGANAPEDWRPYKHGVTTQRYLVALSIQLPITLFSYFYWKAIQNERRRKAVIAAGLTFAAVAGVLLRVWRH